MTTSSARTSRPSPSAPAEHGIPVLLAGNLAAHGEPPQARDQLRIYGSKGTVTLDGYRLSIVGEVNRTEDFDPVATYQGAYDSAIAHFLDGIESGEPFETAPADNLKTLALVDAAYARCAGSPWARELRYAAARELGASDLRVGNSIEAESAATPVHDDLTIARALEEDIIFGRLAPGYAPHRGRAALALCRHTALRAAGAGSARGDGHRHPRAQQGRDGALAHPARGPGDLRCPRVRAAPGRALDSAAGAAIPDRRADRHPRGAWPLHRRRLPARRARGQRPLPPDAVRRVRQSSSSSRPSSSTCG